MTGRYEQIVKRLPHGPDPFDDALVVVWDAVVLGEKATPKGCDPRDTAVVRRVHALETIPPPSDGFFGDLERQLGHLAPPSANAPSTLAAASGFEATRGAAITTPRVPWSRGGGERSGAPLTGVRTPAFPGIPRRFLSMPVAAAVLALLLIAGPLVYYLAHTTPSEPPAIPAAVAPAPELETIVQLDFIPPLWDLPPASAWDHLEFGLLTIAPQATFTTPDVPWYGLVDGPLMIVASSGELVFQPESPALVYRHGSSTHAPVELLAGQSVTLEPNDAIVMPAGASVEGSNPGSEPARALYSLAGVVADGTAGSAGDSAGQPDVTTEDLDFSDHDHLVPGDGASISIRHVQLAPMDTFVYEIEPGLRILPVFMPLQIIDLRIYDGALHDLSQTLGKHGAYTTRALLKFPNPGPHTLVNIGDETVDLYFMVLEPYPETATPAA